jgi:hypothetical protein
LYEVTWQYGRARGTCVVPVQSPCPGPLSVVPASCCTPAWVASEPGVLSSAACSPRVPCRPVAGAVLEHVGCICSVTSTGDAPAESGGPRGGTERIGLLRCSSNARVASVCNEPPIAVPNHKLFTAL